MFQSNQSSSGHTNIYPDLTNLTNSASATCPGGTQVGNLGIHAVTPVNVSNFLSGMNAEATSTLASEMCSAAEKSQVKAKGFHLSKLKGELKSFGLTADDNRAKTGFKKVTVINNLLTNIKSASRSQNNEEPIKKFCEFLLDPNSAFEPGKEVFITTLNSTVMKQPPAYAPPMPSAPFPEPEENNSEQKPGAFSRPSPHHSEYLSEKEPQSIPRDETHAPASTAVAPQQTVATNHQGDQLSRRVQTFKISDDNHGEWQAPSPAKHTAPDSPEQNTTNYLDQIANLSPSTLAEISGNWGRSVNLGNQLTMYFETVPHYGPLVGIRQSAYHEKSINKKDLDDSELAKINRTFAIKRLMDTHSKKDEQYIALELGLDETITFIPKIKLTEFITSKVNGWSPTGEDYIFCTVKLPSGNAYSQGWLLPEFNSVYIGSESGLVIKGFDSITRLEELEETYRAAEGKSFYNNPENVVSLKITPFWGYGYKRIHIGDSSQKCIVSDNPVGDALETDGAASQSSNTIASGLTRNATVVASEKLFGNAHTIKARSYSFLPGKSVYIDLVPYTLS